MARVDIDAKHYQANSSVQYTLAEDALTLHKFRGDERILDMGCGDGKLTIKLAEKVPSGLVKGIDPSKAMIDLARLTFPSDSFKNVSFELGAAEDFFPDGKYDLITAFSCLHWVREQESALERMVQSLKVNGRILALTFVRESPYYRVLEDVIGSSKWVQYAPLSICSHWVSSDGYRKMLKRLHLKALYMKTSREDAVYESKQHFKDYVKGWLPCLIDLPTSCYESFLEDLAEYAQGEYGCSAKNSFAIPYDKQIMYLEK